MCPANFVAVAQALIIVCLILNPVSPGRSETMSAATPSKPIPLPEPRYAGDVSVEQALRQRRSVRSYKDDPLEMAEISQILWSAQGITSALGLHTAVIGAFRGAEVKAIANLPTDEQPLYFVPVGR